MTYAVVLRFDPTGTCLRILHDDSESLLAGEGVRYRFIAETGDHGEAVRVASTRDKAARSRS